jgi:protein-S-isoprenylcysteine O-methyltransferase Ste14
MIAAWRQGKSMKILNTGGLFLFGIFAIYVAVKQNLSVAVISLLVNLGLTLISALSIASGKPFTLQYAREQIPEQYWRLPVFIRTNYFITMFWTFVFLISTIATAASIYMPAIPRWTEIVISVLGLVAAVWFTRWYPAQVRRLRSLESVVNTI